MTTVYKMVSEKTKFFYIGCTSRKLSYRHSGHMESFKNKSFKVYEKIRHLGLTIEDFRLEKIKSFNTKEDGLDFEKRLILKEENNPYILNHMYIEDTWNKGTTHEVSKETREKISKSNKGQVPYSKGKKQPKEHTDKIRAALTGKKLSEEHCAAISKAQKGLSKTFNTVVCPNCGKIGKDNVMHKWHFDNCRYIDNNDRALLESYSKSKRQKIMRERNV